MVSQGIKGRNRDSPAFYPQTALALTSTWMRAPPVRMATVFWPIRQPDVRVSFVMCPSINGHLILGSFLECPSHCSNCEENSGSMACVQCSSQYGLNTDSGCQRKSLVEIVRRSGRFTCLFRVHCEQLQSLHIFSFWPRGLHPVSIVLRPRQWTVPM